MVCLNLSTSANGREDVIEWVGYSGIWGDWGGKYSCPEGSFAKGYTMKVEGDRGTNRDDTAVNGIKLYCADKNGNQTGKVTSSVSKWGSWREGVFCSKKGSFLISSAQKLEKSQGSKRDDTATNSVRFKCSDGEAIQATGGTPWGSWGGYHACPDKKILGTVYRTVICGIQTRIESDQGRGDDDTALNGAKYACCAYEIKQ